MIYWSEFSWEAFATVAAVGAAFWVGRRQTEILKKQTAIQDQSLKSDLFEKRFDVYKRVRSLIEHARTQVSPTPKELREAYYQALLESRFLFEQNVYDRLLVIEKEVEDFNILCTKSEDARRRGDPAEEGACFDRMTDMHKRFASCLADLPDLFHELSLQR